MCTSHAVRQSLTFLTFLGMECFIFATVLCGEKVVICRSKEYSSTHRQQSLTSTLQPLWSKTATDHHDGLVILRKMTVSSVQANN